MLSSAEPFDESLELFSPAASGRARDAVPESELDVASLVNQIFQTVIIDSL